MNALLLCLWLGLAPAFGAGGAEPQEVGLLAEPPLLDPPDDATRDARTQELARGLRCPVCQGLSVADSQSEAALAMRARIRELVAAGYTDDQIRDYFVDRYGTWVLLEPPVEGRFWLLWLGPVALVVAGGLFVGARARRAPASPAAPVAPVAPATPAATDDPYRARILAELEDHAPNSKGEAT